ncbi:MAG: hypothetical protein QM736_09760 [Vicinamibacterales bacterium]
MSACLVAACGRGSTPSNEKEDSAPGETPRLIESTTPGTVTRGDASTDLAKTPISAADYQMYVAIMGGASAMLSALTDDDRQALELLKAIESGAAKATPANEPIVARAHALRARDVDLARTQGIEARYLAVKARIEEAIGPRSKPPADSDSVAKENLRYLEAHRSTIERLQRILNDPLSRPADTTANGPLNK